MHKATFFLLTLCSFLPHFVRPAPTSKPPQWLGSADYQSGSISMSSSSGTVTKAYDNAFSQQPQKMAIGFLSHLATSTSNIYNVSMSVSSNNLTHGTIKYAFSGGIAFSSMSIRYVVISKLVETISCNGGLNYTSKTDCTLTASGSGQRTCRVIGNFTNGTGHVLNVSHTNVMLVWFETLTMKTISGGKF